MVTIVRTRATVTTMQRVTQSTAGANANQDIKAIGVKKLAPRAIMVMDVTHPVSVLQKIFSVIL